MTENKMKFVSLAPTNKAANIISGQTIHRFVIQHSKKHLQDLDVDYIFIDEISMVSSSFYKFFSSLQRLKPDIRFIIVGDFNQLAPVNDKKEFHYKNSYVLYELCQGNRISLSKVEDQTILYSICSKMTTSRTLRRMISTITWRPSSKWEIILT